MTKIWQEQLLYSNFKNKMLFSLKFCILFHVWPRCFSLSSSPLLGTQKLIAFDCGYCRNFSVQEGANPVMAQIVWNICADCRHSLNISGTDLLAISTILFNFCAIKQSNLNFGGHLPRAFFYFDATALTSLFEVYNIFLAGH